MNVEQLGVYYTSGAEREVIVRPGSRGSRLVVDRRVDRSGAEFLAAHLAADERPGNAQIVADMYLCSPRRRCREVRAEDFARAPFDVEPARACAACTSLHDRFVREYRLVVAGEPAQLRWQRAARGAEGELLSVRRVVGALESYEPVCALTRAAIATHLRGGSVSVSLLSLELRRLQQSPIVLNRRLREAVLEAVRRRGVSLSAIAFACGRVKRDRRGRRSGETSWLGRRVGLLADGESHAPNPWVHTDVLALIAREGLGIAPREVELG